LQRLRLPLQEIPDLATAIAAGPVTAVIDAGLPNFQFTKQTFTTMTGKVESLLAAVSRQRSQLGTKGILDFSTKITFPPGGLASLNFLRLKYLNLMNLPLKSLETLPSHPNLRTITADNSQVAVLKGLGSHPSLTSLSLIGAPVSQAANFRLAALILIPKLSYINRDPVTKPSATLMSRSRQSQSTS
jgi:hypothetical protein